MYKTWVFPSSKTVGEHEWASQGNGTSSEIQPVASLTFRLLHLLCTSRALCHHQHNLFFCIIYPIASRQKLILEIGFSVYKRLINVVGELINGERIIYLVNWKVTQKNTWISEITQCPRMKSKYTYDSSTKRELKNIEEIIMG